MTRDRLLDRELLERAFDPLAGKLARRGVVGDVHVFGGAAMVLAFDAGAATRDVDALFESDGPVLDAALEVAEELGLPRSWLNSQASSYVSGRAGRGTPVYDHPPPADHDRIDRAPPGDEGPCRPGSPRHRRPPLLLQTVDLDTLEEVTAVVRRYFPDEPLSDRSRLLLQELLAQPERRAR